MPPCAFLLRVILWVDGWYQKLYQLQMDIGGLSTLDISSYTGDQPVFGLAVHFETAYISVWGTTSILRVSLESSRVEVLAPQLGDDVLFSLSVPDVSSSYSKYL